MAEAADEDILTPDDAMNVCEEIVEAQNKSFNIGLKLQLQYHIVEGIHSDVRYKEPFDQLLHVVIEASKKIDPGLTWGVIVDALRSPGVNLQSLAKKIAHKHCPDKISEVPTLPHIPKRVLRSAPTTRPKPTPKAALRRTRGRSAVLTLTEQQEREAQKDIARYQQQGYSTTHYDQSFASTPHRSSTHRISEEHSRRDLGSCLNVKPYHLDPLPTAGMKNTPVATKTPAPGAGFTTRKEGQKRVKGESAANLLTKQSTHYPYGSHQQRESRTTIDQGHQLAHYTIQHDKGSTYSYV